MSLAKRTRPQYGQTASPDSLGLGGGGIRDFVWLSRGILLTDVTWEGASDLCIFSWFRGVAAVLNVMADLDEQRGAISVP